MADQLPNELVEALLRAVPEAALIVGSDFRLIAGKTLDGVHGVPPAQRRDLAFTITQRPHHDLEAEIAGRLGIVISARALHIGDILRLIRRPDATDPAAQDHLFLIHGIRSLLLVQRGSRPSAFHERILPGG